MIKLLLITKVRTSSAFGLIGRTKRHVLSSIFEPTSCLWVRQNQHATRLSSSNNPNDEFLTSQVNDLVNELLDSDELTTTPTISNEWMSLTSDDVRHIVDRSSVFRSGSSDGDSNDGEVTAPVEKRIIRGQRVWWVRDDLLKLHGSLISGNKARKLWTLNEWAVITDPNNLHKSSEDDVGHDLPSFPDCIVSYGGPQSNAMLALAAIVNYKNRQMGLNPTPTSEDVDSDEENIVNGRIAGDEIEMSQQNGKADYHEGNRTEPYRFIYYTKKLPRFLRNQPSGNFFRAKTLGMEIRELTHDEYNSLFAHAEDGTNKALNDLAPPLPGVRSLFIPQGGAFNAAREGSYRLANEIFDFWKRSEYCEKPLTVCIPGGTCSTALLVHHGLKQLIETQDIPVTNMDVDDIIESKSKSRSLSYPMDIEVVVIPCVGNEMYARRQMMALNVQIGMEPSDIPTILTPFPDDESTSRQSPSSSSKVPRYYTFGKPHKDILRSFEELRDKYDVAIDLLYGAPSWSILFRHWDTIGSGGDDLVSPDLLFDPYVPLAGREIMYVHSGGVEGVSSQMLRYKYDGLVRISDVQLPGKESKRKNKINKTRTHD